jgi:homoserine dehydrogenase
MGVVGTGVAQALVQRAGLLQEQAGLPLKLTRVLVRDAKRARGVEVPRELFTTDPARVIDDPDTDIVVELMGGEEPAHAYIRRALEAGCPVVTANKEVMAKHGPTLQKLARERGAALLYEASVGGGIPLIATIRRGLAATRITAVRAIINGTTNYILTRMAKEGIDFSEALSQAQKLGYAEPDPRNDVEGIDAAYKLAVLAGLAFRTAVPLGEVYYEGIGRLTPNDFRYAQELGYTIKLLAITKEEEDGAIQTRVHPAFLHEEVLLAKVDGVYNAIQVDGDLIGQLLLYGQGAGSAATTSAVLSDVLEIAQDIALDRPPGTGAAALKARRVQPMDDLEVRYYIRMTVVDRPGVMAQVARVLGEAQISIASIIQKETDEEAQMAELVIMTHLAREAAVRQASAALTALEVVREIGSIVRVEE